jgi:uncharacterized membrane protein
MSEEPLPQAEGESREAYVARVAATIEVERVGARRYTLNTTATQALQVMIVWLFRHWLWLANLSNAALLALAFASPLAYALGWDRVGGAIFGILSTFCTQVPTHSYYLFDYQVAFCQRNLAIYGAMLLGGLYYAWLRRSGSAFRPLPLRWFIVLALPLVIDGFTQLFGWRQSNVALRTFTGGLFGFAAVATIYPWFDGARRKLWTVWQVRVD